MKILKRIANFLGFEKNSSYVKRSLTLANIRSTIFMGAIIAILEIFFIIENIATHPTSTFEQTYYYTTNYWIMLLNGLATILFACLFLYGDKFKSKILDWASIIISLLSFSFCFITFFKFYNLNISDYVFSNIFFIGLFAVSALSSFIILLSLIYRYFKGTIPFWTVKVVVVLFAMTCLIFGMRATYLDRLRIDYTKPRYTEMIPFLTMTLYVACLLVWRPILSLSINAAIAVSYYYIMQHAAPLSDANAYNYLTYFVSLSMVSATTYLLRLRQAKEEEQLIYYANFDELTGTHSFGYFLAEVKEHMNDEKPLGSQMVFLFINVSNFKNFNDQRGFIKGNECLKRIGELVALYFGDNMSSRQSDDHFVAYTSKDNLMDRIDRFNKDVAEIDTEISLTTKIGLYESKKENEEPRRCVDKARYACSYLGSDLNQSVMEYDDFMDKNFRLMQYVIHNIDKACKNGWVRPFYQPVVWAKDEKLCGVEALARWIDPEKGFLSPASFVPTLEKTKLVYKLDACILECVCRDIRKSLNENKPIVPVSINFSRLDFELMDAVNILEELVAKYRVPKSYLHVEITESALVDDMGILTKAVTELKSKGYALWLDDFGSGYSSLNVLKDYNFDVLKIDMKFLSGFERNPKAKTLIESIIDMAEKIGMKTLTEGVETANEKDFLNEAGCGRLQGYFFGKPLSYEDLYDRINKKELIVSKDNLVD